MISIRIITTLLTLLFTLCISLCYSQSSDGDIVRKVENINSDWFYLEHNTSQLSEVNNHKDWQSIDLPHTWNQWDAVDNSPGYRRDVSWYKKELNIDRSNDAQYVLYFEGINISSVIYVNGKEAGRHIGGYVGFEIDITDYLDNGKNSVLVKVDNSYNRDVIPSQKADFFIYGGITRDVWLKTLPKVNMNTVKVSTSDVSKTSATTSIDVSFHNIQELDKRYSLRCKILDPTTRKVISQKELKWNDVKGKTLKLPIIKNPKLWSPDNPHLYTVTTELLRDNRPIDRIEEKIGYRYFHFEPHGAFYLNGERMILRGTHRHEEHAGYGSAMSNDQHRKDIEQIKGMGANFLRLGHYPQDPEVYKACDELGIIVWDELPWCRGGIGESTWRSNTERLLQEQITQNYNHSSILFWSLGNEVYWLPDFENGDDTDELNNYVSKLNKIVHELDNSRMTAIRKFYSGADLVDVFSPSIWSGWYAGVYTNYENTLKENHQKYPNFLHMEYGGSSHVGRHTENPITGEGSLNEDDWTEVSNQVNIKNIAKSGDWTENYIVDLFDWYLGVTENNPTFSGNAQWAFKDFGTPLRPENAIPYLNQKGLVDRAGNPKDAYYVFKSYWSNEPFAYIESHTWTERQGPEDKLRNVCVFSNCSHVELIHKGASIGKKKRVSGDFPACGLNWDINFSEGQNELIAHGYEDGNIITSDTMLVNYSYKISGKADHVALTYKKLDNGNYLIEAKMKDKEGANVLDYEKYLYFSLNGTGELLKNYGTPTRSQVIEMANGYAAIELIPSDHGKAIIEARNQDFKGSYLIIEFDKE